ncbi:MAG: hypothetical protein IRZ09_14560 [Variibacter sp.]|nr:hypothetical protein [Variibacter sp.]
MTELIYVPAALIRERGAKLELARRVISPGLTLSGVVPLVATDGGGLWRMEFEDIQLTEPDHRRAWRAIAGFADGGANKLVVPFADAAHQPWPVVGGEPLTSYGAIPHADGTLFADDSGYQQPVIMAHVVGSAALRATQLTIAVSYGGPLRGGEHFSIDHPTMRHRIYRVVSVEESGGNSLVTIRPPLREAVTDGTRLEFDEPKCVMQPETPDALDIMTDIISVARPSPRFIEAFF